MTTQPVLAIASAVIVGIVLLVTIIQGISIYRSEQVDRARRGLHKRVEHD